MTKFTYKNGVGLVKEPAEIKVRIRIARESKKVSWHNSCIGREYDAVLKNGNYLVQLTFKCGGYVEKEFVDVI